MKKKLKVLLAFVLIAVIAVGAYFLLSNKDNSKLVHQNVYNLTHNIKNSEKNIVEEISSTLKEMNTLNTVHAMQLNDACSDFQLYLFLEDYYGTIKNFVLNNGNFVKANNIDTYIRNAQASYNKMYEIYNTSYQYLKDEYYKIENKSEYVDTVKSYIQNFYEIFKPLIPEYNNFYYNISLAYAYGLQDTMQNNIFYKLKVAYYAETLNQFYNNYTSQYAALSAQVMLVNSEIQTDLSRKYFNNKEKYDTIFDNVKNINVAELAIKIPQGKESEVLNALTTPEERQLVQDFIDFVVRG